MVRVGTMVRSCRPLITVATKTLEVTTSKITTIEITQDPLTTTKLITAEKRTRIATTETSEKTVEITQAENFENEVIEVVKNVENDLLFGGFGIAWIVTGLIIILSAIRLIELYVIFIVITDKMKTNFNECYYNK